MNKLIMIGAMYENGGNTTHRFLDGHPELQVYPFESQLGTKYVNDFLSSLFPNKYRWPVFPLENDSYSDYKAIIDEECKVRARTPNVSKFRHVKFDFSDDERLSIFQQLLKDKIRTRHGNVLAFFESSFKAWKNYKRTGQEKYFVGYSPIITVDAEKILKEISDSHFIHVVRNPWSAYADTKTRPVPLSLEHYILAWNVNQFYALQHKDSFPDRFHILRTEDLFDNSQVALEKIRNAIGIRSSRILSIPTWNGEALKEISPWGTIRHPNSKTNYETACELSSDEKKLISKMSGEYIRYFGYENFLK